MLRVLLSIFRRDGKGIESPLKALPPQGGYTPLCPTYFDAGNEPKTSSLFRYLSVGLAHAQADAEQKGLAKDFGLKSRHRSRPLPHCPTRLPSTVGGAWFNNEALCPCLPWGKILSSSG